MKPILTALFAFLTGLNPLFTALTVITVTITTLFTWVNGQWALMLAKIDLLAAGSFAGSMSVSPIGLLNTFIPLTETLTMFTAWLALLGVAGTVRIVKSIIPTVAS